MGTYYVHLGVDGKKSSALVFEVIESEIPPDDNGGGEEKKDYDIISIINGSAFTCALLNDNTVSCWGENYYGELGNGTDNKSEQPKKTSLTDAIQIDLGLYHACALKEDKTVWCWGNNSQGQLGVEDIEKSNVPIQVNVNNIIQIAVGDDFVCSLNEDKEVLCWGNNSLGQLGNGENTASFLPVKVDSASGSNAPIGSVSKIAVGKAHACALKDDKTLWCWGGNSAGQLGDATKEKRNQPVQVKTVADFYDVAAGDDFTCGLRMHSYFVKTAWCWGGNYYGQVGNGELAYDYENLNLVSPLKNLKQIACGSMHVCALEENGDIWCWGRNSEGQLGDGNVKMKNFSPVKTIISQVEEIYAKRKLNNAHLKDGKLWLWGHQKGVPNFTEAIVKEPKEVNW